MRGTVYDPSSPNLTFSINILHCLSLVYFGPLLINLWMLGVNTSLPLYWEKYLTDYHQTSYLASMYYSPELIRFCKWAVLIGCWQQHFMDLSCGIISYMPHYLGWPRISHSPIVKMVDFCMLKTGELKSCICTSLFRMNLTTMQVIACITR